MSEAIKTLDDTVNAVNTDRKLRKDDENGGNGENQQQIQPPDLRTPDGRFQKGRKIGRPKGARNRVTAAAKVEQVERELGQTLDPLEGMAKIAWDEKHDIQIRLAAMRELAKYLYAQRKAVDMSIEETRGEASSLSDSDLESIIQADFGGSGE